MNERIKELIEECTITDLDINGNIYEAKFDKEKFAALIVLECMDMFTKDLPEPGVGRMTDVIDRACRVAEHFGVD